VCQPRRRVSFQDCPRPVAAIRTTHGLQASSVSTMESREHGLALFGCQSRIRGHNCWVALAILLPRCIRR